MTGKEFMNKVVRGKDDFLQRFLDMLKKDRVDFCVIGGLAVNAYVEPVVSLDLDIVIAVGAIPELILKFKKIFKVEEFPNSLNISEKTSDLRIQIQTDSRYQEFIKRSLRKNVLGYDVPVATLEDVFMSKIWAATDKKRRASKRQKDLADIMRLIEFKKELASFLPGTLKKQLFSNQ